MFKIEDFDIKLDTDFIGRNFLYSEEVDSTNGYLLGDSSYTKQGTVLLSEYQTKGRGRKNREWISASKSNLTFSILITQNLDGNFLTLLNIAASVSVAMAIENLHQLTIDLKWPNDVLVNGKKLAGILTESVSKGNKIEKAVIGIGINVNQASFPGRFEIYPTSVKSELKKEVSRERLLSETLNQFEEIYKVLLDDPNKILDEWRTRCKMLGENVTIIDESGNQFGKFVDIAEDGSLILKQGEQLKTIRYGDMSLRKNWLRQFILIMPQLPV